MSNKTQLQTNNTALDGYIARINAAKEVAASLPEAGGSGNGASVETCTVTLSSSYNTATTWYYTDASMTVQTTTGTNTVVVSKNTIIAFEIDPDNYVPSALSISGNCTELFSSGGGTGALTILGDCQIFLTVYGGSN